MLLRRLLVATAAVVLAGCATTTLRDQWGDASWRGGPFGRLLVLGESGNVSERRTFEDIMVERLRAAGVEAIPAYRYLPSGEKAPEATLDDAVRTSGADGLLTTRVVAIDRRTTAWTSYAPLYGPGWYGRGWYGPGWYGFHAPWYPVTDVRQYDVAWVETTLFPADGKRVVWSGVTQTYEPTSVARDAPGFADVIVKALQQRGLLQAGK